MKSNDQNKSRMTGVVAIFAVVIAVVAYFGIKYPIQGDDVSGTIAPAERYRGEQISDEDVTLGDESVAEVMQMDVYQLLISDTAFAASFASDAFRNVMASDAFRNAMASDAFRNVMASDAFPKHLAAVNRGP